MSINSLKNINRDEDYSKITSKDFGNIINLQTGAKQLKTIGLVSMLEEMEQLQQMVNSDVDEIAKFGGSTTEHYLPLTIDYFSALARRIGKSYGPRGANTYITRNDNKVTKDGISILLQQAYDVTIFHKFLNLAVEQSKITLKKSGDGTTTAIITLAHVLKSIYNDPSLRYTALKDTSLFGNVLNVISKEFAEHIKGCIKPIDTLEDIMNVIKVSLNYDEVAIESVKMLFTYCEENGVNWKDSIFQVSGSSKNYSYVDMEHGISTYSQPVAKGENIEGEKKDEKAQVMVISQNLSTQLDIKIITHIIQAMATAASAAKTRGTPITPLYIVVPKVETAASAAIFALLNKYKSEDLDVPVYFYELTPLNTEQTNEIFRDFLTYFGQRQVTLWDLCNGKDPSQPIDEVTNPIESLSPEKINLVAKEASVIRTTRKTTFIPKTPDLEAVKGAIESLKMKLEYAENIEQSMALQSRISVLEGSKCLTLRIHHDVIPEAKRLLDQLEDAILAMNSAIQNGIVLGANLTTYKVLNTPEFRQAVIEATGHTLGDVMTYRLLDAITEGIVATIYEIYKNNAAVIAESSQQDGFEGALISWVDQGMVYDLRSEQMSSDIVNPVDTDVAIFTATTTLTSMLMGINQVVHENIVDAQDYIRAASNYVKSNTGRIKAKLKPAYNEYDEFVRNHTMNGYDGDDFADDKVGDSFDTDFDGDKVGGTPFIRETEPKKSIWKQIVEFFF